MHKINKDTEIQIINLCKLEGLGILKISKKLNINKYIVKKIFLKYNIKSNQGFGEPKYKFNTKEINYIVDNYKNGKSIQFLCRHFSVCPDVIKRILKNNGITKFRTFSEQKRLNLKYKFNEDFFSVINSHEKAYFLGFLYADGYNYEETGRISLSLQDRDIKILKQFWEEIKISGRPPIYTTKKDKYKNRFVNGIKIKMNYDLKLLRLISKKLSNDLAKLGCIQAKSKILTFPNKNIVSDKYLNSFLLGYFDGDGCINTSKCNGPYRKATVTVTSSKYFIKSLKIHLKKELNINCRIRKGVGCFRLEFSASEDILNFYNYIYKNSKCFLDRKKNKFIEFFVNYKKLSPLLFS